MFQPSTLQGTTSNGYSIVLPTPANLVNVVVRSGEFWVRPKAAPDTVLAASGVNAAITVTPATAPVTVGWLRMLAGDNQTFGVENAPGVDPITQLDFWCVASGDVLLNAH